MIVKFGSTRREIFSQFNAAGALAPNLPSDKVIEGLGAPAGVDIFDMLLDLETALQGNDVAGPDGINAQIDRFDAARDQILGIRAEAGARMNRVEGTRDALSVMVIHTIGRRSEIEDVDLLTVYSDFARFQQAFEAALQSGARVTQPSLLDFLR